MLRKRFGEERKGLGFSDATVLPRLIGDLASTIVRRRILSFIDDMCEMCMVYAFVPRHSSSDYFGPIAALQ